MPYTLIQAPDGTRSLVLDLSGHEDCTVLSDAERDAFLLQEAKASAWEQVKSQRTIAEALAVTSFGTAQSDEVSRGLINGLVTMASIAQASGSAFSEVFTMADNSEVTMSAAQMIQFGVEVGSHIAAVWTRGRELRAQIEAAADEAAVAAIDITSGWPS